MGKVRVELSGGGPVDGFPMSVHDCYDVLAVPYNDEMLALLGAEDSPELPEKRRSFQIPSVEAAKAIAIYRLGETQEPHFDQPSGRWIGGPCVQYVYQETLTPHQFRQRRAAGETNP